MPFDQFTPRAFKSNASSPRGMLSLCPLQSALRAVPSLSTVKKNPAQARYPPPPKCLLRGRARFFEPKFTLPPNQQASLQMPRLCACTFARANAYAPLPVLVPMHLDKCTGTNPLRHAPTSNTRCVRTFTESDSPPICLLCDQHFAIAPASVQQQREFPVPPTAMSLCVCPVCVHVCVRARACVCVHACMWQCVRVRVRVREHPGVPVPGLCLFLCRCLCLCLCLCLFLCLPQQAHGACQHRHSLHKNPRAKRT